MSGIIPLPDLIVGARRADRPVAWVAGSVRTHGDFAAAVSGVYARTVALEETRWLLACEGAWDFAVGLFGLLAAGKTVVIPPNFLPGTKNILRPTFEAVLADTPTPESEVRKLTIQDLPRSGGPPPRLPEHSVIEMFTSGTTGEPKQVIKRLSQLDAEVSVHEQIFGRRVGDARFLATVPHQHIYGLLFRILWPLAAGRSFLAEPCSGPDRLLAEMTRSPRAVLISSPAHLSRLHYLLDLSVFRDRLSQVFSSGGPLAAEDNEALVKALGQAPVEVFGSTESGGVAWRQRGAGGDGEAWTLLPGVTASADASGGLVVYSPFTGSETVRMGDAVEVLPDGRLRLGGRLDRLVKLEEKRVSLTEMENFLRTHPLVADAAVVHIKGQRSVLGAAVVLRQPDGHASPSDRKAAIESLRRHLAERFEPVLLPRRWRFPALLPYNDRGKLPPDAVALLFRSPSQRKEQQPGVVGSVLPRILAARDCGAERVLSLYIDPELPLFPGHFPGDSLLPGIVQLDWAIRCAADAFGPLGDFQGMEKVKFQALIRPGEHLELRFCFDLKSGRLRFVYEGDSGRKSSGTITFSPRP